MSDKAEITEKALLDERRQLLRELRQAGRIDLKKFANRANISYAMLSQFENGKRNLSEKAWKRVRGVLEKYYHRPNAAMKAKRSSVREIIGRLDPTIDYPVLIRRYDERARQELREERELTESLRDGLGTYNARVAAWLEAEIALQVATQRAMDAAEVARSEFAADKLLGGLRDSKGNMELVSMPRIPPFEFPETMALVASERDAKTRKVVPWRRKKLSKPEPSGSGYEIRIANNPREEAELRAGGWKEVPYE